MLPVHFSSIVLDFKLLKLPWHVCYVGPVYHVLVLLSKRMLPVKHTFLLIIIYFLQCLNNPFKYRI